MLSQVQVQLVGGCNCLVKKMYINPRSIKVKEFHYSLCAGVQQ